MEKLVPANRQYQLQRCLQKLGLAADTAVNWALLDQALTHATAAELNYERLELLGDAALRLAATELLMDLFPEATVGQLSAVRSRLVSDQTLSELAETLGLPPYLITSADIKPGHPGYRSMLADALEAVLGVLYLETANLSLIRPWLDPHFRQLVQAIRQDPTLQDYKTALQQLTQARYHCPPVYHTQANPLPTSDQERYISEAWVISSCWGQGVGPSKKQAEKAAAKMAYEALQALPQEPWSEADTPAISAP